MVPLSSNQRCNLSFPPANEVLLDDHRTSSSFFIGNRRSSSLSHREKLSFSFTEVIPSVFLFPFQRDKGMVPQERVTVSSASVEWGEDR
jgi:hypothetical protein